MKVEIRNKLAPKGHKRMELQLDPKTHAKIKRHFGFKTRGHFVESAVEGMK